MKIEALFPVGTAFPTVTMPARASDINHMSSLSDIPDTAAIERSAGAASGSTDASLFARMVDSSSALFERAQGDEKNVAAGRGSLLDMSVDRARADALLSVLGAAASRVSSAFSTFANMAV